MLYGDKESILLNVVEDEGSSIKGFSLLLLDETLLNLDGGAAAADPKRSATCLFLGLDKLPFSTDIFWIEGGSGTTACLTGAGAVTEASVDCFDEVEELGSIFKGSPILTFGYMTSSPISPTTRIL